MSPEARTGRIVFVITGLATGGAEIMLYKLLEASDALRREALVVSLRSGGELASRFDALSVPVVEVGWNPGIPDAFALWRLVRLIRREKPQLVATWLYHADLVGGLAASVARVPVVWNIRNSYLDPARTRKGTRLVVSACARLSHRVPVRIICCSQRARVIHESLGYDPARFHVVPNGFDLQRFVASAPARASVRKELGVPEEAPLVGLVARFDPQKNHQGFLRAAAQVRAARDDAYFLLAGTGVDGANPELRRWIADSGLGGAVRLLGRRDDVPRLMAALDVLVSSSSYGEAFPNVLGEAMACEVPCVATDVGDSAEIIGDTGVVVPPGDSGALAEGMLTLLALPAERRRALGRSARARVRAQYEIGRVARLYEQVYAAAATGGRVSSLRSA